MNASTVTPENIHGLIRMAKNRWQENTKALPARMYIGKVQDRALTAYANRYLPDRFRRDDEGSTRRQYECMEIFVVDADNHIDFSCP